MKVLISSIACAPGAGSEGKVGWDAVKAISEQHECHVITHSVYRQAIEQAQSRGESGKAIFHYHGKPYTWYSNRLLARLQSWWIYSGWQRDLLPLAASLHASYRFDVSHHLTYASWRIASPLWMLPIPFVWGPIGGAGHMPRGFRHILSPAGRLFEEVRDASTYFSSRRKDFLLCVQRSSVVLAANSETRAFLRQYRVHGSVRCLPNVFFTDEQIRLLDPRTSIHRLQHGKLRIFAGGNIIGSKGLALALNALSSAKKRGLEFAYTIAGGGPEIEALKQLCGKLDLSQHVVFHPGLHGAEYRAALKESDVYLMPSFRETAGITMLEAILSGCFPIVADITATGEIARKAGGCAVSLTNPEEVVSQLADALLRCYRDRSVMNQSAQRARRWVASNFSQLAYLHGINSSYAEASSTCIRTQCST